MPVIHKEYINSHILIGLWRITEKADVMLKSIDLRDEEKLLYTGFRTEERRKQWLSYRLLIKELTQPDNYPVHYNDSGKPFLAGSKYHLSVSHTGQMSAVILSDHMSVGIDIEMIRPRIIRVKEKYLSHEELMSVPYGEEVECLTLYWCAKEALYKLFGERNLDFRENMQLEAMEKVGTSGSLCGRIIVPGFTKKYKLAYENFNEYMLVYAYSD